MQISPVATPPEIEEALSSGSPSARTQRVEVIMPFPRISPANRTIVSATNLTRTNQLKRARCTVGSPTLRIISQIQLSTPTTRRSPRSSTAQNACGKTTISIVDNNIIKFCNLFYVGYRIVVVLISVLNYCRLYN